FFQIIDFKKVAVNDRENFEHQGEYYKLTKSGENYYLEYALTLDDAELNQYEDIEAYSGGLYSPEELKKLSRMTLLSSM
ncbi:hypothetical protein ACFLFF_31820, partial [Brevibacillus reuszeri]|uniref:hypothetical protein n=1 Tax=Brevibacillus reuszeri TaxID=54915 RepID=UPI00366E624B